MGMMRVVANGGTSFLFLFNVLLIHSKKESWMLNENWLSPIV
jgi:hypothetical protein